MLELPAHKPIDPTSIIKAYDRYAAFYDVLFGLTLQHGRRTLATVLQAKPGQKILEIGVGSGLMLPLYPRNVEVLGVDISEKMLGRAQAAIVRHRLEHIELQLLDAECADLPVGAFDHVVLPYVYSVTSDPDRLIRQARMACKPGGSIWVLNHFSQERLWSVLERPLRRFADSLGFRTDFSYETYVSNRNWDIVAEYKVNLFALSRLIQVHNTPGGQAV